MEGSLIANRKVLLALALVIVVLVSLHVYFQKSGPVENDFSLLHPDIAEMGVDEFLNNQKLYETNYISMKNAASDIFKSQKSGVFGFYFESLRSGAWVGINEKDGFVPGSLMKIPTLVAVMKKVEDTDIELKTNMTILKRDMDPFYGPLFSMGYGYNMTIRQLMNYTAAYSDNTAFNALGRLLDSEDYQDAMFGLGVPYRVITNTSGTVFKISPKDYSNMFRSLYLSSYLRRASSQFILSMLANTEFTGGIPAGVPAETTVSHKVGIWEDGEYRHDCGIVYAPGNPYIICVMTMGLSETESNRVIGNVSQTVYNYVISLGGSG